MVCQKFSKAVHGHLIKSTAKENRRAVLSVGMVSVGLHFSLVLGRYMA